MVVEALVNLIDFGWIGLILLILFYYYYYYYYFLLVSLLKSMGWLLYICMIHEIYIK